MVQDTQMVEALEALKAPAPQEAPAKKVLTVQDGEHVAGTEVKEEPTIH